MEWITVQLQTELWVKLSEAQFIIRNLLAQIRIEAHIENYSRRNPRGGTLQEQRVPTFSSYYKMEKNFEAPLFFQHS
jgi:hypothetical protein